MELDVSTIDTALDSRAVTFENPTGGRGAGGTVGGGRKGAPWRRVETGERVVLADLEGPGTLRHWWMTFPPAPPAQMRSLWLEVFYDGRDEPSISVPCLDFFGLPWGRPVAYSSALTAVQEGRGFNSFVPLPFERSVRVEVVNASDRPIPQLYFQLDLTLEPDRKADPSYLHVTYRRENPTTMGRDFVITEGFRGPGRFLGCVVGVRVLDQGWWYGEGEVKIYRDGDGDHPTICGTGLEDYVGTAWGMGPHAAPYGGAPLEVKQATVQPELLGFYRWHVLDPVIFEDELRVTIQQIGMAAFAAGQEEEFDRYSASHPAAGNGWYRELPSGLVAMGICERVDDYCAAAFVYCRTPQAVPRVERAEACDDIERRPYEQPDPIELLMSGLA